MAHAVCLLGQTGTSDPAAKRRAVNSRSGQAGVVSAALATMWGVTSVPRSLEDLRSEQALAVLVDGGENEYVERKVAVPKAGLGPTVSAFANTDGGWLLLGVADRNVEGRAALTGFTVPGRADLRDWMRDKLSSELGVVPSFRAELMPLRGHDIGIVHVPRSPRAPHTMADGRTFVRENGRTAVVTDAQILIEILARARASVQDAETRLNTPGAAAAAEATLGLPRTSNALHGRPMLIVLRAAPAYVPPSFQRHAMSRNLVARSSTFVLEQASLLHDRPHRDRPYAHAQLHQGGHSVSTRFDGRWWQGVTVVTDRNGVVGMRLDGTNQDGVYIFIDDRLRAWLVPALGYISETLHDSGALGPVALNLTVGGIRGTSVFIADHGDFGFPVDVGNWFETTVTWEDPADSGSPAEVADGLIIAMARGAGALIFND